MTDKNFWAQYQQDCLRTGSKGSNDDRRTNFAMGLLGEAVEVMKDLRFDNGEGSLLSELGDCAWYLAAYCDAAGFDFEEMASQTERGLLYAQMLGAEHACRELLFAAGEVCEDEKKRRFHKKPLRQAHAQYVREALESLFLLTYQVGAVPRQIAEANIAKLWERYPNGHNFRSADPEAETASAGSLRGLGAIADGVVAYMDVTASPLLLSVTTPADYKPLIVKIDGVEFVKKAPRRSGELSATFFLSELETCPPIREGRIDIGDEPLPDRVVVNGHLFVKPEALVSSLPIDQRLDKATDEAFNAFDHGAEGILCLAVSRLYAVDPIPVVLPVEGGGYAACMALGMTVGETPAEALGNLMAHASERLVSNQQHDAAVQGLLDLRRSPAV